MKQQKFPISNFFSPFFALFLIIASSYSAVAQTITFDHTYGYADYSYGKSIIQHVDSGYFVLANTGSPNGNTRLLLIKLDPHGIPVYHKEFHDFYLYNGQFIIKARNGDLLITGEIKNVEGPYQPFVMRVDTLFNLKWSYTLPYNNWTFSKMLVELPQGDIVAVGETYDTDSTGTDGNWLKISAEGVLKEAKSTQRVGNDGYTSVSLWNDSILLLSGYQKNVNTMDSVPFYSLVSASGEVLSHVHYGGIRNKSVCNQAVRDSLNNIVNIGYTRMYDDSAYKDFFMLVFNTNMEVVANVYVDYNLWRLTDNEYTSVAVAKNGDIVVGANAQGNNYNKPTVLLHRYKKNDYSFDVGTVRAGSLYKKADYLSQVIATNDGGAILIGSSTSLGTHLSDILICKVDSVLSPMTPVTHYLKIENSKPQPNFNFTLYPNPTTDKVTISFTDNDNDITIVKLYNLQLKELMRLEHNFFVQPQLELRLTDYASGIYFLKIENKNHQFGSKICKTR